MLNIYSTTTRSFTFILCFLSCQLWGRTGHAHTEEWGRTATLIHALKPGAFLTRAIKPEWSDKEISGEVTDSSGAPLPGVTVYVQNNKSIGTATDRNGRYILAVPDDAVLVFSMVGFSQQEISVSGRTIIDVKLLPASMQLGETVVVAFGTKKKSDMIGSVTSINPSDLKVPSSNLTTALAGHAAGIIAFQRSGEPGQDNANFFVRGVTTFGYKTDPLILIDGIEMTTTDLARLQVDDIASFSILKDATATALYGSRAANGVLLITTKEGKVGEAHLSLRVENSVSAPTKNVALADPVTYMKMNNEAVKARDPLVALPYSDSKIANTIAGTDPIAYPANDWSRLLLKDYTMNQRVNLNISGGGGVARYFASGSYNRDNGLLKVDHRNNFNNNISLNSYTLRGNVGINVTKSTQLTIRLSGNFDDYNGPINGGAGTYSTIMHSNPALFPPFYPVDSQHIYVKHIMFGNYDMGQYNNPYADMVKGYKNYSRSRMLAQFEVKQDLDFITKGLSWSTMVNTNRSSYFEVSRFYNPYFYTLDGYDPKADTYIIHNINPNTGTEYLGYEEGDKLISTTFYLQSELNYSYIFKKNELSGMLVYMMQQDLNANAGDLQLSLPYRNLGVSGSANYSYDKRYYIEFNFGYNGSERFDRNHRFGFFPSLGIAWALSEEGFFKPAKSVVSNLRIRATYGIIGNDAIGSPSDRFFYLSNVDMNAAGRKADFGTNEDGEALNGVNISRYSNPYITWEKAKKANLALELGLFDKLSIDAEYYFQTRSNILMDRSSIPSSAGFTAPIKANVGVATGQGTDISVNYKQYFSNGLWATAMGNFTYATSKFKVYEEPHYAEPYRSHVGQALSQTYGLIAENLFVDDIDAASSPRQNYGPYGAGDIKYLDVNRDGQITDADRVPLGYPTTPEIVYGFGFSIGYKSFDLSAFFQGLGNESFWIDPVATSPFQNQTQVLKVYSDSYWSEDDRDIYALWPRLSPTVNENNTQTSTWFMRNGTFLRLKQVEIGYELPKRLQKRIHASGFRLYLNASNLFCFSRFKLWDVEMAGNGLGYPVQRVFNIGVKLDIH